MRISGNKAFTFVELVMVLSVLGIIAANLAVPAYLNHLDDAREKICIDNRRVIDQATSRYVFDTGTQPDTLGVLVDNGYVKRVPECPSGGIYAWTSDAATGEITSVCSLHSFAEEGSGEEEGDGGKDKDKKDKDKGKGKK
jgi:general secretion pathway protein G